MSCCICGKKIENFGNNPYPYVRVENAKCCDNCYAVHVIPLRLKLRDRDYDLYIENGLRPVWTELRRYKEFTEMITPIPFNTLFKDKDYKEFERVKEITVNREFIRYNKCLAAGMSEQEAGKCFAD